MPPMHSAPIDGRSEFRSYSVSSYTSTLTYDDSDTVRKGCSCSTAKVSWIVMRSLYCLAVMAIYQISALGQRFDAVEQLHILC